MGRSGEQLCQVFHDSPEGGRVAHGHVLRARDKDPDGADAGVHARSPGRSSCRRSMVSMVSTVGFAKGPGSWRMKFMASTWFKIMRASRLLRSGLALAHKAPGLGELVPVPLDPGGLPVPESSAIVAEGAGQGHLLSAL